MQFVGVSTGSEISPGKVICKRPSLGTEVCRVKVIAKSAIAPAVAGKKVIRGVEAFTGTAAKVMLRVGPLSCCEMMQAPELTFTWKEGVMGTSAFFMTRTFILKAVPLATGAYWLRVAVRDTGSTVHKVCKAAEISQIFIEKSHLALDKSNPAGKITSIVDPCG